MIICLLAQGRFAKLLFGERVIQSKHYDSQHTNGIELEERASPCYSAQVLHDALRPLERTGESVMTGFTYFSYYSFCSLPFLSRRERRHQHYGHASPPPDQRRAREVSLFPPRKLR